MDRRKKGQKIRENKNDRRKMRKIKKREDGRKKVGR